MSGPLECFACRHGTLASTRPVPLCAECLRDVQYHSGERTSVCALCLADGRREALHAAEVNGYACLACEECDVRLSSWEARTGLPRSYARGGVVRREPRML